MLVITGWYWHLLRLIIIFVLGVVDTATADNGVNSYSDASDNPYLRTPNFYGFDQVGPVGDRWTDIFGEFKLPLQVRMGVGEFYDTNVIMSNIEKLSSFATSLTPSLSLPFGSSKYQTVLNYNMRGTFYEAYPQKNTIGNYFTGNTILDFNARNKLTLKASATIAQDPIGTMFDQGYLASITKTPNDWTSYGFAGVYDYGAPEAKGHLTLNLSMLNRTYTNHPELTRQRDLNSYNIGTTFLWRVLPKTQVLCEVNDSILSYLYPQNDGHSLNGSSYRLYTGLTWQATEKTRAVLKGGYQIRTYNDNYYKSNYGPAFQGMLNWEASDRDALGIRLSNSISESLVFNSSATNTQIYNLNWVHLWLDRLSSSIGGFYTIQRYTGTGSILQNNTTMIKPSLTYTFRPGFVADLQYTYTLRNSSDSQYSYDRNVIMMMIDIKI